MEGRLVGSFISAVFGLVYVEVNARALPPTAAWTARTLALLALAVILALAVRRRATTSAEPQPGPERGTSRRADRPAPFGRGYWTLVLVEFALILAGARVLSGPLERPHAGVAWVSLVVGLHFFVLARHFRLPFFHLLGAVITACGAAGLVVALTTGAAAVVALVSGVVPGLVLLGSAAWGVSRRPSGQST